MLVDSRLLIVKSIIVTDGASGTGKSTLIGLISSPLAFHRVQQGDADPVFRTSSKGVAALTSMASHYIIRLVYMSVFLTSTSSRRIFCHSMHEMKHPLSLQLMPSHIVWERGIKALYIASSDFVRHKVFAWHTVPKAT